MAPAGYISEPEEEGKSDPLDDELGSNDLGSGDDDFAPPIQRARYDGCNGQGHFIVGMTFANTKEARDAIAKYVVLFRYKLKRNPNKPFKIVVKCQNEEGCPFILQILKDRKNPRLVSKTLKAEHRCQRYFLI